MFAKRFTLALFVLLFLAATTFSPVSTENSTLHLPLQTCSQPSNVVAASDVQPLDLWYCMPADEICRGWFDSNDRLIVEIGWPSWKYV
jgi:hypothetical protein